MNDRRVELRDAQGRTVGEATLTSVPVENFQATSGATASPSSTSGVAATTGVRFHIEISSLKPGSHGLHVHAAGSCVPPDFRSAGAHFNPGNRRHGLAAPAGPHAGDLPNLPVGADGRATVDVVDNLVTLEAERDNSLAGPSGSSLVIHARLDDEVSDPAGNSGDRVACGVISPGPAASASASPSAFGTPRAATPSPRPTATTATASPSFGHGTGLEGFGTPLPSP